MSRKSKNKSHAKSESRKAIAKKGCQHFLRVPFTDRHLCVRFVAFAENVTLVQINKDDGVQYEKPP